MKKLFFFSLFGVLILSGCNKTQNTALPLPEPASQQTSLGSILPPDTWTYEQPQIIVWEATGRIVEWVNNKSEGEYKRVTKSENWENRQEAIVTGYVYTYTYNDLWIKIITPQLYEPYFYKIPQSPIFQRHGNMIYLSWSSDGGFEYIQKLTKDPAISFYDQIKNKHTPSGCKIDLLTWYAYTFFHKPNNLISAMFSDKSLTGNTCIQKDTDFPKNEQLIVFLYNPKNPTVYYKISLGNACAPGPCTIFGNIEFF
jgi:hypothetical protein